jgi:hypothetical protein
MRPATCVVAVPGVRVLAAPAESTALGFATWKMNDLHLVVGEPLRSRFPARTEANQVRRL